MAGWLVGKLQCLLLLLFVISYYCSIRIAIEFVSKVMICNWEGVLTRGDVGINSVGSSDGSGAYWEVMVFV